MNTLNKSGFFVRAMSRSGGTMLATILDSHYEVSMSYEIYPHLLENISNISRLIDYFNNPSFLDFQEYEHLFNRFFLRLKRSNISNEDLLRLLVNHNKKFNDFLTNKSRMDFVYGCCKLKRDKQDKTYFGAKSSGRLNDYYDYDSSLKMILLIRDPRDTFSSQKSIGTFKNDAKDFSRVWVNTIQNYENFVKKYPNNFVLIKYEDLVLNLKAKLQEIVNFLEIPFDDKMLNHSIQNLTIFDNNHLSLKALKKPVNNLQIGRYLKNLTNEEVSCIVNCEYNFFYKYYNK